MPYLPHIIAALAVGSLAYWLRYEFRRAPEYYEPTGVDSIRDCAKGPDGTTENGTKS